MLPAPLRRHEFTPRLTTYPSEESTMPTASGVKSYSLVTAATYGATGTGLDQIVEYIYRDLGLAGATDGKDIRAGAQACSSTPYGCKRFYAPFRRRPHQAENPVGGGKQRSVFHPYVNLSIATHCRHWCQQCSSDRLLSGAVASVPGNPGRSYRTCAM